MGKKVKGLLNGLKYISSIFESNGKELGMQIGFPTDVKHVAHIVWDGPSVNTPNWMNEIKSASSEQLYASTTRERNMVHPSSLSSSQGSSSVPPGPASLEGLLMSRFPVRRIFISATRATIGSCYSSANGRLCMKIMGDETASLEGLLMSRKTSISATHHNV